MEHYRPDGTTAYGWYCAQCGASGVNMMGTGHGDGACKSDPLLVSRLRAANPASGKKPHFIMRSFSEGAVREVSAAPTPA